MQQVKMNFIERAKLVQDYKNGMTIAEITKKYGCATSSAYGYIKDAGVSRRRRVPFDGEIADRMRKEYEAGDSTTVLAARYNKSKSVVCSWIREAGGTIRPRRSLSN